MSAITIQQMAERVASLMEERLGTKGDGLAEKLRRGGRALPRKVRHQADFLAEAAHLSQNPKMLLQIDHDKVAAAYDVCVRHLGRLPNTRLRKAMAGTMSSIALSLLVVAGLVVAVLVWRGFV